MARLGQIFLSQGGNSGRGTRASAPARLYLQDRRRVSMLDMWIAIV